jgi:hypothetical protein
MAAAYHLRHSGVRHTAVLAGRYFRKRLPGRRMSQTVSRVARARRGRREQDVMFGLMVIQHALRGMENRLGEMERRLVDIEAHRS